MNSRRETKLKLAAINAKAREALHIGLSKQESDELNKAVEIVVRELQAASARDVAEMTEKQDATLTALAVSLHELRDGMSKGITLNNASDIVVALQELELSPVYEPRIEVRQDKVELPKDLATNKSIESVSKGIDTLNKILVPAIEKLSARVGDDKQAPPDFKPFRRVVKRGNTYYYDDSDWSSNGGGGGGESLPTILHAVIDQSGAGTDTLVSAVAGKKVRVVSYVITTGASATVQFKSDTTAVSGAMPITVGISAEGSRDTPLFETHTGDPLKLTTTSAAGKGHLSYFLE